MNQEYQPRREILVNKPSTPRNFQQLKNPFNRKGILVKSISPHVEVLKNKFHKSIFSSKMDVKFASKASDLAEVRKLIHQKGVNTDRIEAISNGKEFLAKATKANNRWPSNVIVPSTQHPLMELKEEYPDCFGPKSEFPVQDEAGNFDKQANDLKIKAINQKIFSDFRVINNENKTISFNFNKHVKDLESISFKQDSSEVTADTELADWGWGSED